MLKTVFVASRIPESAYTALSKYAGDEKTMSAVLNEAVKEFLKNLPMKDMKKHGMTDIDKQSVGGESTSEPRRHMKNEKSVNTKELEKTEKIEEPKSSFSALAKMFREGQAAKEMKNELHSSGGDIEV